MTLTTLLTYPEGQYFDRKSLFHGPPSNRTPRNRREVRDQIAKYVAAFANADGGTLLLGVEDDATVTGHAYPDDVIQQMLQVPRERLIPPLPAGERIVHASHELLIFRINPAEEAVMVVGDGFPRRVDDRVILESQDTINAIKRRSRAESIELDAVPGRQLADLDLDRIVAAQQSAGLGHLDPVDYLCDRRLADRRGAELILRQGALLLFARRPGLIDHPNAGVRIFRVDGTETRTGSRHNVREFQPRIEGGLPEVVERAYQRIDDLIPKSTRLHNLFFREMPAYPDFAWQEALVNALAHRDYRQQGRCVEVWLYDDRLEVISPGGLMPEVRLEQLQRRERVHISRNPRLTRVLNELGLMREQGEGIPRMFEEMERSWLRLPELRADAHRFQVVLYNEPILDTPDSDWVRYLETLPINIRQRRVLAAFAGRDFSNSDYQNLNQVDRDLAYREIRELVERGLARSNERTGRAARYEVVGPSELEMDETATPWERLAQRFRRQGFIQNRDYREVFQVSRFKATAELGKLVEQGILTVQGERRARRYYPGPEFLKRLAAHKPS